MPFKHQFCSNSGVLNTWKLINLNFTSFSPIFNGTMEREGVGNGTGALRLQNGI